MEQGSLLQVHLNCLTISKVQLHHLRRTLLPGKPRHIIRTRMLFCSKQSQPIGQSLSQFIGLRCVEVVGMLPSHFSKHLNISRDDWAICAELLQSAAIQSLSHSWRYNLFDVFVADAFKPERAIIQLGVSAQFFDSLGDIAAHGVR